MSEIKEYVCGFLLFFNVEQATFDFIMHPDKAKRKVLLIAKNRPEKQAGKFNGVGGAIEIGEEPLAAMIRECKEETGLSVNDWTKFAVIEGSDYRVHFFKSLTDTIPSWKKMTDEAVFAVSVDDLPKNLVPAVSYLVPLALEDESEVSIKRV